MTYRVTSNHVETLRDGRTVCPGDTVSDSVAKRNPRLVERGALRAPEPKPTAAKSAPEKEEKSK